MFRCVFSYNDMIVDIFAIADRFDGLLLEI